MRKAMMRVAAIAVIFGSIWVPFIVASFMPEGFWDEPVKWYEFPAVTTMAAIGLFGVIQGIMIWAESDGWE